MSNNTNTQPATLYTITASYMCEHFGYYMLRTLLVLYMIRLLMLPAAHAYSTFAAFSALMFVAPMVGGKFIDRNFDHDHAALIGGALLSAGLFAIGFLGHKFLNIALSIIICGKGFYEPGIIASLGELYHRGDSRRERGFLAMYSLINVSAVAASLSAPVIIWYAGWQGAFYTAAGVTIFGTILLYISRWYAGETRKIPTQQVMEAILFIVSGILILDLLMRSTAMSVTFMIGLSSSLFIYTLINMMKLNNAHRNQLLSCLALTAFSIICFTLTQQSAMSLTVFADNNVNRVWGGYSIPTFYFLALNPLLIIVLTPILAGIWRKLDAHGNNPSVAVKFAIGTILLGLGFLILTEGIELNETAAAKLNLMWLVASYFFQTLGELFICPVGLAMITEIAPRQMIGFMIGAWYFAMALANWLAGIAANYTVTLHHPSTHHHTSLVLTAYSNVFGSLGFFAVGAGFLLLLFTQTVNKLVNQR